MCVCVCVWIGSSRSFKQVSLSIKGKFCLYNSFKILSRIHQMHLCRRARPLTPSVQNMTPSVRNMTLNNLIVKLQ